MKQVHGIYLPDGDTTFAKVLERHGGEYQLNRYTDALPYIKRRRTALDIGAHVGMYARQMVKSFGLVYAFEPVPDNYECLNANVDSPGFLPYMCAIGAGAASCRAMGGEGKSVGWQMVPDATGDIIVSTIDALVTDVVDFIKIDVEGMEYDVLLGAEKTILRDRPVILIEEKFDVKCRATHYLASLGLRPAWRKKNDILFIWG
jgi:FkbM family methyltransferase